MFLKKLAVWILAILITIFSVVYQRVTGPTYPKKEEITINGKKYELVFLRSHGGEGDAELKFTLPEGFNIRIYYKRYPSKDNWTKLEPVKRDSSVYFYLPHQPPAGKLQYYAEIIDYTGNIDYSNKEHPVVIRFKGAVPAAVLIPHIIFMFLAMFLSSLAALFAIFGFKEKQRFYAFLTAIFLFLGGMILGPVVQKYAFGEFWTGIPFGWDLTDNKTLIAMIGWLIAVWANLKKPKPLYTILAAILMLVIYLIPHSLYGSQLDYETGEMTQGFILLLLK